MPRKLTLDPDRALPPEPALRAIARELYAGIASLPLISMHGHVDAGAIARNDAFGDPAELFVIPDHYLRRMLVSQGLSQAELGVPNRASRGENAESTQAVHREIWRRFCENWRLFRGTPTRYWLEHELVAVFGIDTEPSADTADALFDELSEVLSRPESRMRPLFDSFGIEILATTDPAASPLDDHARLRADGWGDRVIPTFRPDALHELTRPDWPEQIRALSEASGIDVVDYRSFLEAVRQRRSAFAAAGARASDHGPATADTTPLDPVDAQALFDAALAGTADAAGAAAFGANMLFENARMSLDDGLVMQIHPGVLRDHSSAIATEFGTDNGFDIPVQVEFTRALRPMLDAFGLDPRFRVVLYTIDETVYSRELAPLAGAYPTVRLGAPWWFLDSPGGMARFRELTTETAGFYNTSGFVDDTRAFASIPARHDLARRMDAGYLAKLVATGLLSIDEAHETARDLTYDLPKLAFAPRTTAAL
ncbi:glucuronate isomerase [Microbacterium sp. MPKO10]|uniref:glucuronate isomerase n=1 Tax=Microbacterium sp. MPKO10 TaxID=2989818 RepID=UPI002235CB89|nr:glucuronate isomerase [Microbacterium sp. MPKO10]MCW4459136.1 glucuronate isomerase [Microbacterium sp. MPKO10]